MGCDIHIIIERKFEGRWVGWFNAEYSWPLDTLTYAHRTQIPPCRWKSRNYEFFAALAGVRGEGPDPLGIPEDASDMVRMSTNEDGDDHSHSYCSLREFIVKRLVADDETNAAAIMREAMEGSNDVIFKEAKLDEYEAPLDDYRVVFWFDN